MDLENFGALLLVKLGLNFEVLFVLEEGLDGIGSGLVGFAAVEMSFGEFVKILNFLLVLNFFLVELFALIVLLSFHEHISVVLNFVHFLDAETVII
jgi:hypothetical protein